MKPTTISAVLARNYAAIQHARPVRTARAEEQARNGLAVNATLRQDEWQQIDADVNGVLSERVTLLDDMRAAGLTTPVSIGTIIRVTERLADMDDAVVAFDGDTAPNDDRPTFNKDAIPVPQISRGFTFGWRQLEASRTRGEPLDTTAAQMAARKVRERIQALVTNGFSHGPDGSGIPGLTTAAHRIQLSLGTAWDASSGADPIGNVEAMLNAAYAKNLFGPFYLYVPKNYWATIQGDYQLSSGMSTQTYLARMQAFADIAAVRPNDALADDNVLLVQMTKDVLDYSDGLPPTTLQWQHSPMVTHFRVVAVGGPQIKNIETSAGDTVHGIVHLS